LRRPHGAAAVDEEGRGSIVDALLTPRTGGPNSGNIARREASRRMPVPHTHFRCPPSRGGGRLPAIGMSDAINGRTGRLGRHDADPKGDAVRRCRLRAVSATLA
jgi:hypothetical protein